MSHIGEPSDEFEALVQGIQFSLPVEDQDLNRSIIIVNNYESFMLALCPTGYSSNILDVQRLCYTEPVAVNDMTQMNAAESEFFDMSEFEHYDTMFFRWRSGQLLRVWSQMLGMGSEAWLMFSMVCITSTIQAMRNYYIAMDDEANPLRSIVLDSTMHELFDMFLAMSPYSEDRSPEAQLIIDFIQSYCSEELKLDDVPDGYEVKFNTEIKKQIDLLVGQPIHAIAEIMFELCSITVEIIMQTSKMFEFETPDDHQNSIKNFCTQIRERIVEDSLGEL